MAMVTEFLVNPSFVVTEPTHGKHNILRSYQDKVLERYEKQNIR